jgi:glycosyltransferase involved in cell wall biosynthesis
MTPTVDILLATFNGARFLAELLESVEGQTHRDWRLIARDDGSTDRSLSIVEAFAERHEERVRVLRDGRGRLGFCANFATLLEASDAPYFMFCDQDDVWLPEKIAGLLRLMRQVENRRGAEIPILVHSDLVVVDDELRVLHPSWWRYSRLFNPSAPRRPARVIIQTFALGCASIGNAALRRAALPIPSEASGHDWWVAMVAAILGKIAEHEAPTVLYRQHQSNVSSTRPGHLSAVISRIIRTRGALIKKIRLDLKKYQQQAAAFERAYGKEMHPEMHQIFLEFSHLCESTLWKRKSFLFRHRHDLSPDYWLHAVGLWWCL